MTEFEEAVAGVLAGLAPGDVVTYGEVAAEAGYPGAARAVGRFLATHDDQPWWRVVTGTGRLVPGHADEHARRLRAERVTVVDGRVRLAEPSAERATDEGLDRPARRGEARRSRARGGPFCTY